MTDAESIAKRIESAWCRLAELPDGARATLRLTRTGCIIGFRGEQAGGVVELGEFGRCTPLLSFRETVYRAWESMQRARVPQ